MDVITHKYEFPAENMVAPFGAGWTLSHSPTRSTYFNVGSNLDDIIAAFTDLQDVGSSERLTKEITVRSVKYTRLYTSDSVTMRYPTISFRLVAVQPLIVTGTVTPAEQLAFELVAPGTAVAGWVVSDVVNHAVVTHTTSLNRKSAGVNPRFLAGFEAIDYVQTPIAAFGLTVPLNSTSVRFTNTSKFHPTQWAWDFGDGQGSTVLSPTHRYATGGLYHVRLTVANAAGTNVFTRAIAV